MDREKQAEVKSVFDLLDEIENKTLYFALITVDRRTLQIILLKMQGYSQNNVINLGSNSDNYKFTRMQKPFVIP